jgi:hypothetical protein
MVRCVGVQVDKGLYVPTSTGFTSSWRNKFSRRTFNTYGKDSMTPTFQGI